MFGGNKHSSDKNKAIKKNKECWGRVGVKWFVTVNKVAIEGLAEKIRLEQIVEENKGRSKRNIWEKYVPCSRNSMCKEQWGGG